jgi:hypothetical protein
MLRARRKRSCISTILFSSNSIAVQRFAQARHQGEKSANGYDRSSAGRERGPAMVIRILDIASGADTSVQGDLAYAKLKIALRTSDEITVSFEGVKTATSSFVNTSFVRLLEDWTLDELKRRMRVISSTRQINDMIKSRLERTAMAHA